MSESEPKYGDSVESNDIAPNEWTAQDWINYLKQQTVTVIPNFEVQNKLIEAYKDYVRLLEERYLGGYGDEFKDISELRNKIQSLTDKLR